MELTAKELILLAGVLGAKQVIGVDDPWPGALMAEIQADLARVLDDLEQRGLIVQREDGRILMASTVGELVSVCAFPEAVLLVGANRHQVGVLERHIFLSRNGWAEMSEQDGRVEITEIPGGPQALARAAALLGLGEQAAAPMGASIPEAVMAEAKRIVSEAGAESAAQFLRESGVEAAAASVVSAALAQPVATASVILMAPQRGDWTTRSLGFLQGPDGLWQVVQRSEQGEARLALAPTSGSEAIAALMDLVAAAVPAPVLA